jgi:hypothetical protein
MPSAKQKTLTLEQRNNQAKSEAYSSKNNFPSFLFPHFANVPYNVGMQFRVPQNITMEDRIVGPLTLIQFTILVLGGGLSFLIFTSSLLPSPLTLILAVAFALVTISIALGKFNDQPLYRFFRFIISYIITPKTRIWHKTGLEIQLVRPSNHAVNQNQHKQAKQVSKEDIQRLSVVLDSRGQTGVIPQSPVKQPQHKS